MANVIWGIHTQDDHLFLNDNVIAIGWRAFGDLKAIEPTREAFKKHYEKKMCIRDRWRSVKSLQREAESVWQRLSLKKRE